MDVLILLQLLLAHVLTDFVFQSRKMVADKQEKALKSVYFWIHILLSGLLTYFFLQQWTNFFAPLLIAFTHASFDYWKIIQIKRMRNKNGAKKNAKKELNLFFLDQLLHLIIIIVLWFSLIGGESKVLPFLEQQLNSPGSLSILLAIIFLIWPSGLIIGKATERFRNEISNNDGLEDAGKYIGIFERLLVFIFVISSQYAAIGFLIAGKSILRVSTEKDKESRKKTEYVLIGTLISFTVAVVLGLMVQSVVAV